MSGRPLVRVRRGPAPIWTNPTTGTPHRLRVGDKVTYRRRYLNPWTFTVRTWGTSFTGHSYIAGAFFSTLVTDVTTVERQGERL